MEKVNVKLGENSYEIRVGNRILERVGLWLREKELFR